MLTLEQVRQHSRRRPPPSLKQQYQEYVLQRIEGYKNSLRRGDLLQLGDDAVKELNATSQGQFVLTEVLMLDSVDRIIIRRLRIRPYRRWRTQFLALRKAQREPTHWGVAPDHPANQMLGRIEPGDHVLAVGAACEECACLMAAHDAAVTFIAGDMGLVDRVESRASSESLGTDFEAIVVQPGYWFPAMEPADLVLLDASILTGLEPERRQEMIRDVQRSTAGRGVHVLVPGKSGGLTPDAILSYYPGWNREPLPRTGRRRPSRGVILTNISACQYDTDKDVSNGDTRWVTG